MNRSITRVALTGGIATGKSTVASLFSELGVATLDADALSHEAIAPGTKAWKTIRDRYGVKILDKDNAIDRKVLGSIVFADAREREFLQALIHPVVKGMVAKQIDLLEKQQHPMVIVEVPLLYEVGWEDEFDIVVVVSCDEELQIARCMEKFGIVREKAVERIAAQMPLAKKIGAADVVITSSDAIEKTREQVKNLHQMMLKRRTKHP